MQRGTKRIATCGLMIARPIVATLAVFLLLVTPVAGQTPVPRNCVIAVKYICTEADCVRMDGDGEYISLNQESEAYTRCLKNTTECEVFGIEQVYVSGAFMYVIFSPDGLSYMKIAAATVGLANLEENQFMEVRGSFLTNVTSYGRCTPY